MLSDNGANFIIVDREQISVSLLKRVSLRLNFKIARKNEENFVGWDIVPAFC